MRNPYIFHHQNQGKRKMRVGISATFYLLEVIIVIFAVIFSIGKFAYERISLGIFLWGISGFLLF